MSENKQTSSPVLNVDENGYIILQAGAPDNLITQLGKRNDGKYKPWGQQTYDGLHMFCSYVAIKGYYPNNYKDVAEFIKSLRDQAYTNEYVDNYVDMGIKYLIDYLSSASFIDEDTKFLMIDNNSDLTDIVYDKVGKYTNNAFNNIITLRQKINSDVIMVNNNAPKEAKEYFEPLLDELSKVDAFYSFEELNFKKEWLQYLSGFSIIDYENMTNIKPKDTIVLVSDVYSSGYTFSDAYNQLQNNGYTNIVGYLSLIKQI